MDTLIKDAINKINFIKSTNDLNFTTSECRIVAQNLLINLSTNFRKAPTTAIALVQYLVDEQFNLQKLEKEAYENYIETFGYKLSKFTQNEIEQVRKISKVLFL